MMYQFYIKHTDSNTYVSVVNMNVGDWACYKGDFNATKEDIASDGRKVSEEVARELFPDIDFRYRK